ncbi:MAG: DegV family protein [Ruminococcaceae bacterium]|nr:DegV family protein [Oscillospiraceae bacterium]
MKVRIVIDSTADIRPELRERFSIVPLTIHFGEQEYVDGVDIDHRKFYEMLVESDVMPTTSQATPAAFDKVFGEAVARGETVVALTIASELSGTYQSAVIAAAEYPGRVFVVDSRTAAIGTGILAELALRLADRGMEAEDIARRLTEERDNVCVVAMLDTLEYLKRGGRISKTVAFAGGLLSIKPVAAIKNGEILILGKARGSKQGNNLLVQQIEAAGGVDFRKPVLLGYTGMSDTLLEKYVEDSRALWAESETELKRVIIGSVIGTHAGPGAVAAAFFRKTN